MVLLGISSAQTLFRLLNDFEKISGLAVNPSKTEGLWIGSLREIEYPLELNGQRNQSKLLVSITLMIRNYYTRKTS